MDTTLVGVTLLSMAMAIALSVVVWRLLRTERRRSEARVAALADMMARSTTDGGSSRANFSERRLDAIVAPRPPAPAAPVAEPRASRALDLPLHETEPVLSAPLFSEPEQSSPWRGRAVIMSAIALALAAGLLVTLTVRDRGRAQHATDSSTANAPSVAAGAPLELLSLREARDASGLTITGVVQNPRNGAMLKQVTVTAFAFDANGAFLASGQALLDITALAPGDESPFVVSVPLTGTVARYRIGFRGEDGRVIAHVDKRQRGAVANAAPASDTGT
jgi:hypothetical protein